jgi:DNA-binding XRE family transcriptional regulator
MEAADVFEEIANGQDMSLQEAARILPSSRSGVRAHFSTIFRWVLKGVKLPDGQNVKLEAARLGGKWVTTKAALMRFMAAQTPNPDQPSPLRHVRTPTQRQRHLERVERELDEKLWGYKHCKVCDAKVKPRQDAIEHRSGIFCTACLLKQPDATFAQRLKACRMNAGLRRKDLAKTSGVSHSKISIYERGDLKDPRPEDLEKLVAALGPELVREVTAS